MTRQPTSDADRINGSEPAPDGSRPLSDAARRALAEAAARRADYDAKVADLRRQAEINGPKGPEPVRYGDWENKGVASDF